MERGEEKGREVEKKKGKKIRVALFALVTVILIKRKKKMDETDEELVDYDFDTPPPKPLAGASRRPTSSGKRQQQEQRKNEVDAGVNGGPDRDVVGINEKTPTKALGATKKNDDAEVEDELYGDIVSPGAGGGGGGGGAALLTLQVAEVRKKRGGKNRNAGRRSNPVLLFFSCFFLDKKLRSQPSLSLFLFPLHSSNAASSSKRLGSAN